MALIWELVREEELVIYQKILLMNYKKNRKMQFIRSQNQTHTLGNRRGPVHFSGPINTAIETVHNAAAHHTHTHTQ